MTTRPFPNDLRKPVEEGQQNAGNKPDRRDAPVTTRPSAENLRKPVEEEKKEGEATATNENVDKRGVLNAKFEVRRKADKKLVKVGEKYVDALVVVVTNKSDVNNIVVTGFKVNGIVGQANATPPLNEFEITMDSGDKKLSIVVDVSFDEGGKRKFTTLKGEWIPEIGAKLINPEDSGQ